NGRRRRTRERSKRPRKGQSEGGQDECSYHGGPGKGRRLLLAPRRHYSTLAALSNHGHDPSTACKIGLIATNRTAGAVADPPPLRTLKLCVGILPGNLGKFLTRRECLNVIGLTLGFVGVIPVKALPRFDLCRRQWLGAAPGSP